MTAIKYILSWGSGQWRTVLLECGHMRHIRKADLKREQLFISKRVPCADCGEDAGRMALRVERRK